MTTKKKAEKAPAKRARKKKQEVFTRWDITDNMKTESDIAGYIKVFLEEINELPNDVAAAYLISALGDVARAYGMAKLARDSGISREGLYRALGREGNPSLSTLLRILQVFGLRLEIGVAEAKKAAA